MSITVICWSASRDSRSATPRLRGQTDNEVVHEASVPLAEAGNAGCRP